MNIASIAKATAFLVCLAGSASASSITSLYSSFWVLGDSLSGYVGAPEDPGTLRFSNAPLWSERIVKDFQETGKEAQSYAIPGATAGLDRDIDLIAQRDALLTQTARFGADPLVAIWIGGNDIAAFASGLLPSKSVLAYGATLGALIGVGVTDFLLFEIPDVGFTPLVQASGTDPAVASGAAAGLNTAFFDLVVAGLPGFVDVTRIDTFDLTRTAYDDPGFFGATSRGPCVLPAGPVADCNTTAFWDAFHPTSLVHGFVTDEVRAAYATPVPLPAAGWMLIAAVGGLAALRRRA
jgi:hypothetical protein